MNVPAASMKLAFYFTLACTARCAHCVTSASPKVSRKMSLEEARRVVEQTAAAPDFKAIVFTGGENLIHKAEMLELVRLCTRLGLRSEIITNAFWGTSRRVARAMVEPVVEAGAGGFRISIDRFHLSYVPARSVRTALEALAELGHNRFLTSVIERSDFAEKARGLRHLIEDGEIVLGAGNYASTDALTARLEKEWPPELLSVLADYGLALSDCILADDIFELRRQGCADLAEELIRGRVLVNYQSLATEGRGRELLGEVPTFTIDERPDVACGSVAETPTITPEGDLFPCCSSWVNFNHQRLGNFADVDIEEFPRRIRTDPIAVFMYRQGPGVLTRYLIDHGHLRDEGTSHLCHQCGTLLEKFSRAELLRHIEDLYREQPWRTLLTSRGLQLVGSAHSPIPRANV